MAILPLNTSKPINTDKFKVVKHNYCSIGIDCGHLLNIFEIGRLCNWTKFTVSC